MTVSSDTGAYFFGKKFGNRKLLSKVSPGKTIEGFVGGLFVCCLTVGFYVYSIDYINFYVAFGLLFLGLFSVIGDLSESIFKRAANIKDSGSLLPGHGGFLDRLDSLLAVLPLYFLLFFYTKEYL